MSAQIPHIQCTFIAMFTSPCLLHADSHKWQTSKHGHVSQHQQATSPLVPTPLAPRHKRRQPPQQLPAPGSNEVLDCCRPGAFRQDVSGFCAHLERLRWTKLSEELMAGASTSGERMARLMGKNGG